MAKKDKIVELKQKSRFVAMEGLRPRGGPPVSPRKAMKQARKASKKLPYPVSPYPGAGIAQVYGWARSEWWKLGKWQNLVLPFALLSALLTWEKEKAARDARWDEVERAEVKRMAQEMYLAPESPKRRKLLGIIPLPTRR